MIWHSPSFTCAHFLGLALALQLAFAQKCYYPNGSEAPDTEKACSSEDGSACCPDKWECLDNGMCYYPADKIYGRYSCTDKSWESDGCPKNLCTYGGDAFGGENMQQCSDHDDQWCCNADDVHVDCCKESPEPRPFFDLKEGEPYATIGSNQAEQQPILATITGLASGSGGGGGSSPSSTAGSSGGGPSATKDSNSQQVTGPSTPVTTISTIVTSGTQGIVTTEVTSVIPPATTAGASNSSSEGGSKSKIPLIVGLAVGIPLGLAFFAILFWLFRKRSQQKKVHSPYPESPNPYTNGRKTPEFTGGAKLSKTGGGASYKVDHADIPELAGQSVGPGRPVSAIKGKAELESGGSFAPGAVAHAPHLVGVGGGNGTGTGQTPQSSWGSAPPGYSPGQNQNAWMPAAGVSGVPAGVAEIDGTSARPNSGGAAATSTTAAAPAAPAAPVAPQTEGGRYIPYRPPPGHPGHGQTGLQNVPEMAELSSTRTP